MLQTLLVENVVEQGIEYEMTAGVWKTKYSLIVILWGYFSKYSLYYNKTIVNRERVIQPTRMNKFYLKQKSVMHDSLSGHITILLLPANFPEMCDNLLALCLLYRFSKFHNFSNFLGCISYWILLWRTVANWMVLLRVMRVSLCFVTL